MSPKRVLLAGFLTVALCAVSLSSKIVRVTTLARYNDDGTVAHQIIGLHDTHYDVMKDATSDQPKLIADLYKEEAIDTQWLLETVSTDFIDQLTEIKECLKECCKQLKHDTHCTQMKKNLTEEIENFGSTIMAQIARHKTSALCADDNRMFYLTTIKQLYSLLAHFSSSTNASCNSRMPNHHSLSLSINKTIQRVMLTATKLKTSLMRDKDQQYIERIINLFQKIQDIVDAAFSAEDIHQPSTLAAQLHKIYAAAVGEWYNNLDWHEQLAISFLEVILTYPQPHQSIIAGTQHILRINDILAHLGYELVYDSGTSWQGESFELTVDYFDHCPNLLNQYHHEKGKYTRFGKLSEKWNSEAIRELESRYHKNDPLGCIDKESKLAQDELDINKHLPKALIAAAKRTRTQPEASDHNTIQHDEL